MRERRRIAAERGERLRLDVLSIITFCRPRGGADMRCRRPRRGSELRWAALWTSVITFIVSLFLWSIFDTSNPGFQLIEREEWNFRTGIISRRAWTGFRRSCWCRLHDADLHSSPPGRRSITAARIHDRRCWVLETMMVCFSALAILLLYVFSKA